MAYLSCGLLLAVVAACGYAGALPLWRAERRNWPEMLGLSLAGGFGIVGMVLFWGSIGGARPGWGMWIGLSAAAALGIVLARNHYRNHHRPAALDPVSGEGAMGGASRALGFIAVIVILSAVGNVTAEVLRPGVVDIDGYAIWMFKAKIAWMTPLRPIPPALMAPSLSYSHQDYPLGFPLLVAQVYGLAGAVVEESGKLILLPIYLALVCIAYSTLRAMLRWSDAAAVTALLAAAPVVVQHAGMTGPEVLLVLQHFCCLAMLASWMRYAERRYLLASGIFAAFAAFTKNEGLALMPLVGLAALGFGVARKQRKLLWDWALAAIAATAIVSPWLVYRRYLPRTHEDYGGKLMNMRVIAQCWPRVGEVAPRYLGHLLRLDQAGFIWIVLAVSAVVGWRRFARLPVVLMWGILLGHLALYGMTFVVTPWDVNVLLPMITPKLLMHVSPAAAILIGMHLSTQAYGPAAPSPSMKDNAFAERSA